MRPEEFDRAAALARLQALGTRSADPTLRSPSVVLRTALGLLLQGSYVADAIRRGDAQTLAGVVALTGLARVDDGDPVVTPLRSFVGGRGPRPSDDELVALVWLSSAADALFWCCGVLPALPDGDPTGEEYGALIERLRTGGAAALAAGAGLRPRAEIEAEHARWQRILAVAPDGTHARSHAIERSRALRWVLERSWFAVSATPWDGSAVARPFRPAPLGTA
jgi:hypothetical protein